MRRESVRCRRADDVLEVGLEEQRVAAEPKPICQLERHLVSLHADRRTHLPGTPLGVLQIIAEVALYNGDAADVQRP
jgi:hypothetical protein